jgi:hypothetical protein
LDGFRSEGGLCDYLMADAWNKNIMGRIGIEEMKYTLILYKM